MKDVKTLLLVVAMLLLADLAFAQTWTKTSAPSAGNTTWASIASSANGSKLIALGLNWFYYTSTNAGATWTSNSQPQIGTFTGSWNCIASSADGTKFVATDAGSQIWVSTNSGATWLSNNVVGVAEWCAVASSADGNKLVAVDGLNSTQPGLIYISTNWGVTWTPTSAPTNYWTSVALTADGTKLFATTFNSQARAGLTGGSGGFIYASTNSGLTWTLTGAPTNSGWTAIASSVDGSKLVAVNDPLYSNSAPYTIVSPGLVYTSTNSGATWVSNNVPDNVWQGVASSADGSRLIATVQGNPSGIYTSTNSGATWTSNSIPTPPAYSIYSCIASSADGGILAAGSLQGGIYTSSAILSPQLNLTPSSTNLTLAWTIPSTNFNLQQSADLLAWSNVTNPPVLNLTNLQNQVTLPSGSSGFYRLETP